MTQPKGHVERLALRKIEKIEGRPVPEGFEFFHWTTLEGTDCRQLQGGVPLVLKSGPRKGQKTWKKSTIFTAIITHQEVEAERVRWAQETGLCAECLGEAQVIARWSKKDGVTFRPCQTCQATGKNTP